MKMKMFFAIALVYALLVPMFPLTVSANSLYNTGESLEVYGSEIVMYVLDSDGNLVPLNQLIFQEHPVQARNGVDHINFTSLRQDVGRDLRLWIRNDSSIEMTVTLQVMGFWPWQSWVDVPSNHGRTFTVAANSNREALFHGITTSQAHRVQIEGANGGNPFGLLSLRQLNLN